MSTALSVVPFSKTARPIKKFLLFAGSNYYPDGGYNDFHGAYSSRAATMEALVALMSQQSIEWAHIVTGNTIVWTMPQMPANPN